MELEFQDSFSFTCTATNAFGSDETSINLIVQGRLIMILKLDKFLKFIHTL